ncbi:MAG: S10 family peptidase [Thermoanaerobaculia bacterium]
MNLKRFWIFVSVLAALTLGGNVAAADGPGGGEKPSEHEKKEAEKAAPEVKPVVTSHEIQLGGKPLRYTATAGYMPMKDEEGKLKANIFFVAYTREGGDASRRPVTFAYNGGPGSSSVWLHMGALGPKRVAMADEGWALPPPYHLVDNEQTWLAFTDLVFIDPVTTGFSRPAAGEKPEQFHGLREDIESVGDFIRLYTTRYHRWASPKFLAGESYGTTRSAGLSGYLQRRHGLYLNGITLISTVLNFQTLEFNPGNDLPYLMFLPSETAAAWYHKKLPPDLQKDFEGALAESKKFASGDYALALLAGDRLAPERRAAAAKELSRLTGIPERYVERHDLRVSDGEFFSELLRDEGKTIGRLDARFTRPYLPDGEGGFGADPSYEAIYGPYTALFNNYVREDLKYENDLPYEILTGRVQPWKFPEGQYANVAQTLRDAIVQNPALHVFVAAGFFDFATPFFAAEYTIDHLGLPAALRGNVSLDHFPAGHMMYIQKSSLERLSGDIQAFYTKAVSGKP